MKISIQKEDFDAGAEIAALKTDAGIGAIATFIGTVRGTGGVEALNLEHYPSMTEREIARLIDEAKSRWALSGVTIIHRIGKLKVGENIVLVVTASAHRRDALAACEFLIDQMKTNAPFWKEEERNGTREWVPARASDDAAAEKWRK